MRNKTILHTYIFIIIIFLSSCYGTKRNFDIAIYPQKPINLYEINSEFDDYNSAEPYNPYTDVELVFSTNRKSQGDQFDFVSYNISFSFNQSTGKFSWSQSIIDDSLRFSNINSHYNEFGPYFLIATYLYEFYQDTVSIDFLYASDSTGNLDIYMAKYKGDSITPPQSFSLLNSPADDAYPSIHIPDSSKPENLYFTSNREGSFDIYKAVGNEIKITSSSQILIEKASILSSKFDDKCPYVYLNKMVFTSNRDGGYGGYDLWYSVFENNEWSEPVNFGPEINTQYDEYRPIIINRNPYRFNEFINDLMIFSSNRPGGKGGFDLYCVGIKCD